MKSVEELFVEKGAILKGHFLLTSGLHSPIYWEKFRIIEHPELAEKLCRMIADHYKDKNIDVVVGPTTGGIILAYEVAKMLGVRCVFAEKEGGKRTLKRGFKINPGERILVVDDVLTTGKSVYEVIDALSKTDGKITGFGVLVNRSETEHDFGAPLFNCVRSVTPAYKPENCPLCAQGLPLVKPGSSKQK